MSRSFFVGVNHVSTTLSTLDPELLSALEEAVEVLRRVGQLELDPRLAERKRELGENKERCSATERAEYRAWADFCLKLTHDKLQAIIALKHLREALPDLIGLTDVDALIESLDES
jgi:hypothetical protein